MKIKIDDSTIVWFTTLILKVKTQGKVESGLEKREVYQTICKNSKNELEAYNEAMLEAQTKFHIIQVEAKMMSPLTHIIFKPNKFSNKNN